MTKNNKKTFVTLFPRCNNTELLKDVGMIPYHMHKIYGFDSFIACYGEDDYQYLTSEVKGLKIDRISRIHNSVVKDGIEYLKDNAFRIDVLNVYHLIYSESFQWIRTYKRLNPQGKVYLKLDLDYLGVSKHKSDSIILRLIKKRVLMKCDLISAESDLISKEISELYHVPISLIPNGCYFSDIPKQQTKKSNVFLTVGRLGTKQKATEILLEAFSKSAKEHDWKLKLVGPIDASFEEYKDKFLQANADIAERIKFTGNIVNKEKLQSEYEDAKVFILPSRWESFGIVIAEAQINGCYIITTDVVPPAQEIINAGRFGKIISTDDVNSLANNMIEIAKNDVSEKMSDDIRIFALERYDWSKICRKIFEELY